MIPGKFEWIEQDGTKFSRSFDPLKIDEWVGYYRWIVEGRVGAKTKANPGGTWRTFYYVRVLKVTGLMVQKAKRGTDALTLLMKEVETQVRGYAESCIDMGFALKPIVKKNRANSGKDRYAHKVGTYWVYNVKEGR